MIFGNKSKKTPESKAKADLHSEALKRFKYAQDSERENREIAAEDFEFAAGEQWPEKIKQERQTDGRPCLTINRLPQFIRQVMGDARQNKPAIKVRPVEDSDEEIAEIYEGLIRSIEVASNAPQAYMTALEHCLTGGFGNWRILTEYCDNDTFDQEIKIEPIRNPFAVFWDHGAKRYDRSDADYCFVTEWMSKEEFDRKYPKDSDSDWESDTYYDYEGWVDDHQRVRVAEYWVKKRVERRIYQIHGQVYDELPEGFTGNEPGIRSRKVYDIEIERYLLSGKQVLEGPKKWAGKYIPIIPVWGVEEYVNGHHHYLSLIRHAKDPQRMYNYWQSTITEKVALAPKSPWLITTNEVKGLEVFWNNANVDNLPYLPFNPDPQAPGRPQRNQPAALNQSEIAQAAQSIDDMKATTGIYDASLGARGNETSGVAIRQRQMEGDTSTYAWIDNLGRSIEHTGRVLVDLIPKIYDTTRVVQILYEDESTESVTLNEPEMQDIMQGLTRYKNDLSVGKYDVVINVGPSYSTKRQEAADSMMAFIQAYPMAAQLCGDLVAKNMDWPGADEIAERLKMANPIAMQDDPEYQQQAQQQQQIQQQAQQQQFMLSMKKLAAEAEEKAARAAKTLQDVEKGKADIMEVLARVHKIEEDIEAQRIENAHFASQPEGESSYSSGS